MLDQPVALTDGTTQIWNGARELCFASCSLIDRIVPNRGVPVLLYHSIDSSGSRNSISSATFARQMRYLRDYAWTSISVDDLLDCIARGDVPRKRCVITFDDGFRNILTEALPVLEACGFTATVFLATAYVGGKNTFVKSRMSEELMLGWNDVRTLAGRGWRIESHGHTHSDLPLLNRAQVQSELCVSREQIEQQTSIRPKHFCYPRGKFTPEIVAAVRSAGYQSAMSLRVGLVRAASDPWQLERLWVGDTDLAHFRAQLTVPYSWYGSLRRVLLRNNY